MAAAIVNVADFGVHPDLDEDQTDRFVAALRCIGKTVKGVEYGSEFSIGEGRYRIDFARAMRTMGDASETEAREKAAQQVKTRPLTVQIGEGLHFESCSWDFKS